MRKAGEIEDGLLAMDESGARSIISVMLEL